MDLINKFKEIRAYTVEICEPLETEDFVVQVATFVSPVKWHLAHTTWFFETFILKEYSKNYTEFNKDFGYLFNSYYNNVGDRILRPKRGNLTRPSTEMVYKYRAYVNENIEYLLSTSIDAELKKLVILGLNHEEQHQELLYTDIKYMFGHNPLLPSYKKDINIINNTNDEEGFVSIEEGVYQIGYAGNDFFFDNEGGVHKTYLNHFEISKALVTNEEFIEFINSGGYKDFNLWLDEGWAWLQANDVNAPLYWYKINDAWYSYTLSGLKKIDPTAILCHVSHYEASAYAEWKHMRLPTEFEWEIASEHFKWGNRWEWTNSAYLPYPNFSKDEGALGEYNGKFMSNQMVLRGASVVTSKNHSRKTYRNFFHHDARWQFSGIRLAK